MSRSICFYFRVHQPYWLRTYRFFDIGKRHFYYDEYKNRQVMQCVAERCYLPVNEILKDQIKRFGNKVKYSFYFSGSTIELMESYAPDAMKSFRELVSTGNVELLAGTYSHSLVSLVNKEAFKKQVIAHKKLMKQVFGLTPKTFLNTDLIYSNEIGACVADMGYNLILTEGAKHVLGWKSPNYMYVNAINPKLKILLRNFKLSDDISIRFSQDALNADAFVAKLNDIPKEEEVVNIYTDYETFGDFHDASTGIVDFLKYLPEAIINHTDYELALPYEMIEKVQPLGIFDAPIPLSSKDEERDLSFWLGNDLQDDAFKTLYDCYSKVKRAKNEDIQRDWNCLQNSDNFYNLCTKCNNTLPYDYYINFMNVLTDFKEHINNILKK